LPFKQTVAGSNPAGRTIISVRMGCFFIYFYFFNPPSAAEIFLYLLSNLSKNDKLYTILKLKLKHYERRI
jgi:hypothetical protein